VQYQDLVYRIHARQSMFTRSLSDECVEQIVRYGEVIEDYPHAFPFPAKLLLGWSNGRSFHVVAAEDRNKQLVIVITAYEPTLNKWEPDRKTRRKHS
jgi:Domain of unknown function (DUF4258)